jgi:hypothetical protein
MMLFTTARNIPYPAPDESTPRHLALLFKVHLNPLLLLLLGTPHRLFPSQVFGLKFLKHLSQLQYLLHTLPTSSIILSH